MADIREITGPDTHALRRSVLRTDVPNADVHFTEDDLVATFHLGAFVADTLVGVASFSPSVTDLRPGQTAWQLRGMAVIAEVQGQGVGALLIVTAVDRLVAANVAVLWCNARDTAAGFYERLEFVTHGDGFRTVTTGLPHHVMLRDL